MYNGCPALGQVLKLNLNLARCRKQKGERFLIAISHHSAINWNNILDFFILCIIVQKLEIDRKVQKTFENNIVKF